MGPFVLVLLTLNARTGDLVSWAVVGRPFAGITACMHAAIERGPQKSTGDAATVLVCRSAAEHDYTALRRLPGGRS